jgi:hypothetical protein
MILIILFRGGKRQGKGGVGEGRGMLSGVRRRLYLGVILPVKTKKKKYERSDCWQ